MEGAGWGARLQPDGRTRFRLWAPTHDALQLWLLESDTRLPMSVLLGGWHERFAEGAGPGTLYKYVLPDGRELPDPASLYQPQGPHGPSQVQDLAAYRWVCAGWAGRPWHEAVLYELHVGAFTTAGTFRAAIEHLHDLKKLGITAVQLMPVAEFSGRRNWGYDGVMLYAPASAYGTPQDLQAFVDAAHAEGLMVMLDVVYNHFGPDGNFLGTLAPPFFTARHATPWGHAIDFALPPVRQFLVDNALHWLEHYRLDGLRFDAVHAMTDDSDVHIADAIAKAVRAHPRLGHVHLVLENEHNDSHRLARRDGAPVLFTAQWNDDVHHALHVAATGESEGYYGDYVDDMPRLARSLAEGFAFQGERMAFIDAPRGAPSAHLPPTAFITFLENHDQVGNRACGERLPALARPEAVRALEAVYLLLPQIPMLFMGEEWGTTQPFPFFCDFPGALGEAVVAGRRREFARFAAFADPVQRERIPDPTDEATFRAATLQWEEAQTWQGKATRMRYEALLALRRREIVPLLPHLSRGADWRVAADGAIDIRWQAGGGRWLRLEANLTHQPAHSDWPPEGRILWQEGRREDRRMPAWYVLWTGDAAVTAP